MWSDLDDVNWWIEQEKLAKQQELESQVDFIKEQINTDIAENIEKQNLDPDSIAIKEYYNLQSHLKSKHALKNRKTYERRNRLKKENGIPIKRWTKWEKRNTSIGLPSNHPYLKQSFELVDKLDAQLNILLENGNIIPLFKLYGIELKETYYNYKGFCLYHRENTPSFSISKSKWVCKCFGCGKGYQMLRYLFYLNFWEHTTYKLKRLKKLEQKIAPFLELPPCNHFDVKWNPVNDAILPSNLIKAYKPRERDFHSERQKIKDDNRNQSLQDTSNDSLPF